MTGDGLWLMGNHNGCLVWGRTARLRLISAMRGEGEGMSETGTERGMTEGTAGCPTLGVGAITAVADESDGYCTLQEVLVGGAVLGPTPCWCCSALIVLVV